jgi:uncharacterized membrane protein
MISSPRLRIQTMSLYAMLLTILLMMGFIPSIGFITINPAVSFTLMHVPVIIAAFIFGWKGGVAFGFGFGLISFIQAVSAPRGILDPFFQNPLIAIPPRLIFGGLTGLGFNLIFRFVKVSILQKPALAIVAFLATVLHTILTLSFMGMISGQAVLSALEGVDIFFANYGAFIAAVLALNGIWEALIAMLIIPLIALAVRGLPMVKLMMAKTYKEIK